MEKIYLLTLLLIPSIFIGAQPINDDACNAILLAIGDDCSAILPYDNIGATAQMDEPFGDCYNDGSIENTVWFAFVAPSSGAVSIDTDFANSGLQNSQLTVFRLRDEDCTLWDNFEPIACNEDKLPEREFTEANAAIPPIAVTAGLTYFIQVDGFKMIDDNPTNNNTNEGSFCLMVNEIIPPENDDCDNADIYGGFGPICSKLWGDDEPNIENTTTIGATAGNEIDFFSCDGSPFNATVYYTFHAGVSEVELNFLSGEHLNVALLTLNNDCNSSVEVTGNCFTDISALPNEDLENPQPEVLFTNLVPLTPYLMAIWTNEGEATDFEFCLTRTPNYVCGDSICYELAESYTNCQSDCPCISSIELFSYQTGQNTIIPEAVCPEIVGDLSDSGIPGLYVPFTINTNDPDLTGSFVLRSTGALFASTDPPIPLPNSEATNSLMYLFLTATKLATGGNVTISFNSDAKACTANLTFDIADLIKPETTECGDCTLKILPDYINACCGADFIEIGIGLENAIGPKVWVSQDNNIAYDAGTDILLALDGSTTINLPTNDLLLTFYDEGKPNCAIRRNLTGGDFICGQNEVCINPTGCAASQCRLNPIIRYEAATCNLDSTLNVPIDIGSSTGAVIFTPSGMVGGSGTSTDPYAVHINLKDCQPVDFTLSDESTCDVIPIVTVNSPPNIAGGIHVSDANYGTWNFRIETELGICETDSAVVGTVALLNDGDTSGGKLTDFCEPTPPELPATSVCAPVNGKIALIDRGQCGRLHKVENAQNCGAIGVVICDCFGCEDEIVFFPQPYYSIPITIPAVFMPYADCEKLKMELNKGNEVVLCIGAPVNLPGCSREFTVDVCEDFLADYCENNPAVLGCTNADACNYDAAATVDDESCFFTGDSCDDNNDATIDDVYIDCNCRGICTIGSFGDACDDGNDNSTGDAITVDCVCMGLISCNPPIDELISPAQTTLCVDEIDLPTFSLPASALPDVAIVVEVNGTIVAISEDGNFDSNDLKINDEVCYTAMAFDIAVVEDLIFFLSKICGLINFSFSPDPCQAILDLTNRPIDPLIIDIEIILNLFLAISEASINSLDEAIAIINPLNETFLPFNLEKICYSVSNTICLPVVNCNGCTAKPGQFTCD